MKKFLLSIFALMLAVFSVQAQTSEPVYSLVPVKGSNQAYAGNCDITIDGITWNLTGNSDMLPWRMGGKSITNVDRTLYSKTQMTSAVSKVVLSIGTMTSITVNSAELLIADNADFSNATAVSFTPKANADVEIPVTAPAGSYYKFVFNVTVSVSSNKYIQIKQIDFYAAEGDGEATPVVLIPEASVPSGVYTAAQNVTFTSEYANAENPVIDYYYTTDGSEPTKDSSKAEGAVEITESCTVKVIAVMTVDEKEYVSNVASYEYIISEAVNYVVATNAEQIVAGKVLIIADGKAAVAKDAGFGDENPLADLIVEKEFTLKRGTETQGTLEMTVTFRNPCKGAKDIGFRFKNIPIAGWAVPKKPYTVVLDGQAVNDGIIRGKANAKIKWHAVNKCVPHTGPMTAQVEATWYKYTFNFPGSAAFYSWSNGKLVTAEPLYENFILAPGAAKSFSQTMKFNLK
jgi:hypothetical protein